MFSIGRVSIVAAAFGAFAFVAIALTFAPAALAQTMGEYGATVSHAAGTGAAVPSITVPSSFGGEPSARSGSSGSTHTEVIHEDDESDAPASDARSSRKDTNTGNSDSSDADWQQVK